MPLHDQKIDVWCTIAASRIVGPIFFENAINSERYVSDILRPFLGVLRKKKRHMVILCKIVLQHTLLLMPLVF
jgi:hypothetical protein